MTAVELTDRQLITIASALAQEYVRVLKFRDRADRLRMGVANYEQHMTYVVDTVEALPDWVREHFDRQLAHVVDWYNFDQAADRAAAA